MSWFNQDSGSGKDASPGGGLPSSSPRQLLGAADPCGPSLPAPAEQPVPGSALSRELWPRSATALFLFLLLAARFSSSPALQTRRGVINHSDTEGRGRKKQGQEAPGLQCSQPEPQPCPRPGQGEEKRSVPVLAQGPSGRPPPGSRQPDRQAQATPCMGEARCWRASPGGIAQLQAFKSRRMHSQRNTSRPHTKAVAGECRPLLFSSHKPCRSLSAMRAVEDYGERHRAGTGTLGAGGLGAFQQTAEK